MTEPTGSTLDASGPADGVPALDIRAVSHAFGARKALDDVSLTVPAGSFTDLQGPNRSG